MGSEGSCSPLIDEDLEWEKVGLMRAFVEDKDPQAKEADNFMIRRFLRARDLDIDKASTMFLKYLKWKREFVPNGFISDAEVKNELAERKFFVQGFDRKGHPLGVAFTAKFNAKHGMDEHKRFVVSILDTLCSRTSRGQEKVMIIADLKGWGYSNCNVRAYLAAIDILQMKNHPRTDHYSKSYSNLDHHHFAKYEHIEEDQGTYQLADGL
ncbi:uncharacterized protein A4U43_C10F4250 [Asparagus officinalis]|uniref:CRAL/TRIO N-terminal domain-containing protein n=1 Tax=Asparagus officinalis TaxID=4686 RepID=A0A5P1E0K7_ASPOF|nr:uncharacterized protein A4U43_C10F4250 [Asparagus officinalis]